MTQDHTIDALLKARAEIDERLRRHEDAPTVRFTDVVRSPSSVERLGDIPSRYEILSQVGTGGTGMVYKGRDLETGDIVALKILKPEIAPDPAAQENFKRELCLARRITHKNVCRMHEFNRANGAAYISMEFVEGESLLSNLDRVGPLPATQALDITRQICAGLREAHAQGIVHRDLKPANIMVDRSGNVKIMDFGVARLVQANSQSTRTIVGTPKYMAPEQAELKPVDARTDIYAVGLLLYEMVTGCAAFDGDSPVAVALKQIRESPKRPREIVPTLPTRIESAILKCLEKDPGKRFQSVAELEAALEEAATVPPAPSWRVSLVPKLRQGALEGYRAWQSLLGGAKAFVQRQDWAALNRIRTEPAMALAAALLLGGLMAFILGSGWKSQAGSRTHSGAAPMAVLQNAPAPEAAQEPSSARDRLAAQNPAAVPDTVSSPGATRAVTTQAVDLSRDPDLALSAAPTPAVQPARSDPVLDSNHGTVVKSSARRAIKRASASAHGKDSKAQVSGQPAEEQTPANSAPPETPDTPVTDAAAATAVPNSPEKDAAQPASSKPGAPARDAKADSAKPASEPALYLEVGRFKDEAWADSAVEKLTGLGFHAVCVHKSRLWMQSYHVQVGPYTDPKEMEAAQQRLAKQGFKAHPVK